MSIFFPLTNINRKDHGSQEVVKCENDIPLKRLDQCEILWIKEHVSSGLNEFQ